MVSAFLLAICFHSPATRAADEDVEAQTIVQELVSHPPLGELESMGLFKQRLPSGQRVEVPVKLKFTRNGDGWQERYITQPVPERAAAELSIQHQPKTLPVYLQGGATPDLYSPFAGTDFWVADLGLQFLHWPEPRIIKREMRKGRSCRVVACRNPDTSTGYGRVLCWIDLESGGLIRAEAYDQKNQLLKTFSIRSLKKIDGVWQLRAIEITNELTDSRTRLEFSLDIREPK